MIKKTKWIETHKLGKCKLRYPLVVKLELVSDEPVGSKDYWVASCCTLSCHAVDAKKKRALHILGDIVLHQLVSYRETAPDGNTADANILLRLLEILIADSDEDESYCDSCDAVILGEIFYSSDDGEEIFCSKRCLKKKESSHWRCN